MFGDLGQPRQAAKGDKGTHLRVMMLPNQKDRVVPTGGGVRASGWEAATHRRGSAEKVITHHSPGDTRKQIHFLV